MKKVDIGRRELVAGGLAAGALAFPGARAMAQGVWPTRPVRIVVPFTPGTGMDILARTIGPKLGEAWGQPVVIENRPGASGNIGAAQVARSAPDGHTLLMGVNTLVINPSLYANMQYDPLKDLAPIGLAATGSFLLVANAKAGIASVKDLVARAKARPGELNYASPGVATPHHMAMELFKLQAGIFVVHIPFSGTGPALTQLLGGELPLMFLPVHVALPHVRGGRLVALAAGGTQRVALAPEVPTLVELGYKAVEADLWYGLLAPAGLPREIASKINDDMQKALATADLRTTLSAQGMTVTTGSPEQMAALMRKDAERWAKVVRTQGIRAE